MKVSCLLRLAFSARAQDQDNDGLKARRLYYQDNSPEIVFKSSTVAKKPTGTEPKPKPQSGSTGTTRTQQIENIQDKLRAAAAACPELKPAATLGVRYNVMKQAPDTLVRTIVPPETVFHENECVAVRIQPNRGGFLFVFSEGSSGTVSYTHLTLPTNREV